MMQVTTRQTPNFALEDQRDGSHLVYDQFEADGRLNREVGPKFPLRTQMVPSGTTARSRPTLNKISPFLES